MFRTSVSKVRINRGGIRWGSPNSTRALEERGLDAETAGGCSYHTLIHPNNATVEKFTPEALQILDPRVSVLALHKRTGEREHINAHNSRVFRICRQAITELTDLDMMVSA